MTSPFSLSSKFLTNQTSLYMYTVWNTNKSLTCIHFLLHWCSKFAFLLNIFWNDHSCNSPELLYNYTRRKYTLILPLTEVSFSFLHCPQSSSKVEKAPDTWGTLLNMTGLWCAIKTKQKTIKQTCRQRAQILSNWKTTFICYRMLWL